MAKLKTVDNTFEEYWCTRCGGKFINARKRTWIVGTKRNLCMTCTLIVEGAFVRADGQPDWFDPDYGSKDGEPAPKQQQPAKPVTKTQQRNQSDIDLIFQREDEIPF